jgi:hypothetical protein
MLPEASRTRIALSAFVDEEIANNTEKTTHNFLAMRIIYSSL